MALGDLNGHGRGDLVTANSGSKTVSVLFNEGGGRFGPAVAHDVPGQLGAVALGDLNAEGKADVAALNGTSVTVLLNKANSGFQRRDYASDGSHGLAIGDLNGDRRPDLATTSGSNVSVLANRGDGSFRQLRRFGRDRFFPLAVAMGDLNGDLKLDLATANGVTNDVSVLTNANGRCAVPDVRKAALAAARQTIVLAGCRVGKIRRAHSKTIAQGCVISQTPRPGPVLPRGASVNLVVSRGTG